MTTRRSPHHPVRCAALTATLLWFAMRVGAADAPAAAKPPAAKAAEAKPAATKPAEAKPAAVAPPATPASAFAGQEACEACHADQAEAHGKTAHGPALADPSRPEAERGCEACHGAGQAHADEGGGVGVGGLEAFDADEPAAKRSAACLHCHAGTPALHDVDRGAHAKAGLACTDCHAIHENKGRPLLAKPQAELCGSCHLDVRAEFALPEHHKVPEGVMACTDCHAVHGTPERKLLKAPDDRTCTACHGDVEGPFVFEHPGNVTESCERCHAPHGGIGRHLLIRRQVAQVCLECHAATPSDHLQPSFRDCTRCHTAIHGSNTDPHLMEP